ncbi:MAG: DNA topoisomerase IV subunit A [Candidatus Latescibacteria bacterium]|jgi:topoisomerase IV subunit A|nr:DNA topoisomerase IV subunit A [Candidatus Latescibacterota bacterium]MBT4141011.1 DNA topoisomerase IV subunit A [Candidatus Latescibacterota bacterium]
MAYIDTLFDRYYMEHASYVIKDRAIPNIDDGLKPVQRRILHALKEQDDGKFHKVANIVGQTMKYHPHGDLSINGALVNLANKDLLIEKQGNFGNILTGDSASAARYIECRLTPLANDVLFNHEVTEYIESYDGRNNEPVSFPAKIPVLLIQGTEGIASGMSTKILPHNFIELLQAQIQYLKGKDFQVFPDFPTGGFVDVTEYADGNGKVLVRAKLDTKDPKSIIVRQLPFGTTTESLIASVEAAARKNKLKIAGISDFTGEDVEIEIRLARGVHSKDTVDALYAFTDCEQSISINALVIKESRPHIGTVTNILKHNADHTVEVLTAELKIEQKQLRDKLHAKTLEQIFIEERVYKAIEEVTEADGVIQAVFDGLVPYQSKIKREVTKDDVDTLLRIPIRRISLYDINKAQREMRDMRARLKEIKTNLGNIIGYTIDFIEYLVDQYQDDYPRRTEVGSFDQVDVREAAQRNLKLRFDKNTGYLGYDVNGNTLLDVSQYDRVLVIRQNGMYSLHDAPDRLFVDKGMHFCDFVDPERIYTVIYREKKTNYPCIKRCTLDKFIMNKGYELVPEGSKVLKFTTDRNLNIHVNYKPKPRVRILEEEFAVEDYIVKGKTAKGVRLANREVKSVKFIGGGADTDGGEKE